MNKLEVAKLLTAAAAIDNRKFQDETVEAWHVVLEGYGYADCAAAVRQHFETSDEYLMPVHVARGAMRVRAMRERALRVSRPQVAANVITLDRAEFDRLTAVAIAEHRAGKTVTS